MGIEIVPVETEQVQSVELTPEAKLFLNRIVKSVAVKTIIAEAELAKTLEIDDFIHFFADHEQSGIRRFIEDFPIIPMGDKIIVKVLPVNDRLTASGVLLPETSKEVQLQGIVVASGPGWTDANGNFHYNQIRVGHHVLFHDMSGMDVRFGDAGILFRQISAREVTSIVRNAHLLKKVEVSYE